MPHAFTKLTIMAQMLQLGRVLFEVPDEKS